MLKAFIVIIIIVANSCRAKKHVMKRRKIPLSTTLFLMLSFLFEVLLKKNLFILICFWSVHAGFIYIRV